jgi:pilus assembly protein Flp/PilA
MRKLNALIWKLRLMKDTRGQDLIEYALMAGFVAVAAGAVVPSVADSVKQIFSKLDTVMQNASSQG